MRVKNSDLTAAVDARLEEAISHANYRITLNLQRKNAKIKLEQALVFAFNGGTFNLDPAFLGFVGTLVQSGRLDVTLLDVNSNPINVPDLQQFLLTALEKYTEATNAYMAEMRNIGKARTTKALIER